MFRTSRIVTRSRKTEWSSESLPEGTTSKEMELKYKYIVKKTCYKISLIALYLKTWYNYSMACRYFTPSTAGTPFPRPVTESPTVSGHRCDVTRESPTGLLALTSATLTYGGSLLVNDRTTVCYNSISNHTSLICRKNHHFEMFDTAATRYQRMLRALNPRLPKETSCTVRVIMSEQR